MVSKESILEFKDKAEKEFNQNYKIFCEVASKKYSGIKYTLDRVTCLLLKHVQGGAKEVHKLHQANVKPLLDQHKEYLSKLNIEWRVAGLLVSSSMIFLYSRGIRPRFRKTLFWGTSYTFLVCPELLNPFKSL